jgi:hypothetical protein
VAPRKFPTKQIYLIKEISEFPIVVVLENIAMDKVQKNSFHEILCSDSINKTCVLLKQAH